jgi:hypothetical protein
MPANLHDRQQVNPSPTHVRDRRMPEVMEAEVGDSRPLACCHEGPLQRANLPATVQEDVRFM